MLINYLPKFVFCSSWTPGIPRNASVLQIIEAFMREDALSIVTLAEENRGARAPNYKRRKINEIKIQGGNLNF